MFSFIGLWEKLHNPEFKGVDFNPFLTEGGNSLAMSPSRLVENYNAIGFCKSGRNRIKRDARFYSRKVSKLAKISNRILDSSTEAPPLRNNVKRLSE